MKKIYNFLVLALLFVASTSVMQAQKRYGFAAGALNLATPMSIDEVSAGSEFVLQSGDLLGSGPDFVRGASKSTRLTEEPLRSRICREAKC